jgi:uridylate kinase
MLIAMEMDTGMIVKRSVDEDYSQEVMQVGWNPVVPAMQEVVDKMAARMIERHTMPVVVAEVDVDAFLREMYAAQR